jgi:hypothetical protein
MLAPFAHRDGYVRAATDFQCPTCGKLAGRYCFAVEGYAIRALSCEMNLLGVLSRAELKSYALGFIDSCCKRTLGKVPAKELVIAELESVS